MLESEMIVILWNIFNSRLMAFIRDTNDQYVMDRARTHLYPSSEHKRGVKPSPGLKDTTAGIFDMIRKTVP